MKLALGTVQFGLPYGVTNHAGLVPDSEVREILNFAKKGQISLLDTAHSYGSSEAVLGKQLFGNPDFQIVTKTKTIADVGIQGVTDAFHESLRRLKCSHIYAVLAHNAQDLISDKFGPKLFALMQEWKSQRLVQKIGASVYTSEELDALEKYSLDIVQVPLNALDQRLISSGHLHRWKQRGVEIHARSIFLQGALLVEPSQLPPHFSPYRQILKKYHKTVAALGLSPIEGALLFLHQQKSVDYGVIGVCSKLELEEILNAYEKIRSLPDDFWDPSELSVTDAGLINPSLWRKS
jgi:aryl-alcohol dehydrogenase-like predicted oxidoreductase